MITALREVRAQTSRNAFRKKSSGNSRPIAMFDASMKCDSHVGGGGSRASGLRWLGSLRRSLLNAG